MTVLKLGRKWLKLRTRIKRESDNETKEEVEDTVDETEKERADLDLSP